MHTPARAQSCTLTPPPMHTHPQAGRPAGVQRRGAGDCGCGAGSPPPRGVHGSDHPAAGAVHNNRGKQRGGGGGGGRGGDSSAGRGSRKEWLRRRVQGASRAVACNRRACPAHGAGGVRHSPTPPHAHHAPLACMQIVLMGVCCSPGADGDECGELRLQVRPARTSGGGSADPRGVGVQRRGGGAGWSRAALPCHSLRPLLAPPPPTTPPPWHTHTPRLL